MQNCGSLCDSSAAKHLYYQDTILHMCGPRGLPRTRERDTLSTLARCNILEEQACFAKRRCLAEKCQSSPVLGPATEALT